MIDTVAKPKTRTKVKTERPRLHKVILVNDDYTPREFVVTVLRAEFHMTEDQAYKVMIPRIGTGSAWSPCSPRTSPKPRQPAPPKPVAPRATRCYSPPSPRNRRTFALVPLRIPKCLSDEPEG